ncbi:MULTISPECIES: hypothetical protein [unclassified Rhizobium]|uniref:hypothetical protein n=1 Tax=unclassified Rhizobium TaxID=2613769 RepID=UPI0010DB3441|nr:MULTISPECIES: hypothetical protein [unclassified Rhizobium]MBB4171771.1 hypothetical protein [Rhizobium sp. BK538]TCM71250.1 hypothetical protein EV291_123102 [Rhizobium sp. BK068]
MLAPPKLRGLCELAQHLSALGRSTTIPLGLLKSRWITVPLSHDGVNSTEQERHILCVKRFRQRFPDDIGAGRPFKLTGISLDARQKF